MTENKLNSIPTTENKLNSIPTTENKLNSLELFSSENVFNSTEENKVKTPWRCLANEERIIKLHSYFESEFNHAGTEKSVGKTTICMLEELVNKGKLKLKKEIKYDKVNERIMEITALVPEPNTDHYIYKPELLVKRQKTKKMFIWIVD